MHSDLFLFAQMLVRVGFLCGFIPSILCVYVAEMLVRANRVPARKVLGKVVSDGLALVNSCRDFRVRFRLHDHRLSGGQAAIAKRV